MNFTSNIAFLFVSFLALTNRIVVAEDFKLTILHLNDVHARFEQTNIYSGRCPEDDKEEDKCFGGMARIHAAVKKIRSANDNVVFLSAGDYFQGTVWYTIHKWMVVAHFLNILQHDAMSLGNHEFDDGIEGLAPFINNVTFPVLAANVDASREPRISGLAPSVVLEKGGKKIGIVGYLTTETTAISMPGPLLKITDEVEAVRNEARRLKGEGVDIIIALGHAGFRKDIAIAKSIKEVDAVVGGHTNTFLYTGKKPSTESVVSDYPHVVTQASGRKVPVVQAYAFGKYLGRLDLTFNKDGEVTEWAGNPILLDNSIKQDKEVLGELTQWSRTVDEVVKEKVGTTRVFLDGDRLSCRRKECNMANLLADALIYMNMRDPDELEWASVSLAVMNGGSIRASIDEQNLNGTITMEDIMTVAPFQNTIDLVDLRGKHVREMFEHSVAGYDITGEDLVGAFLQVSGFQVTYDIYRPVGQRVVRLQARCSKCRVPELKDVQEDEIYRIAIPSFLAKGGDGYSVIEDNVINHHLTGFLDSDVFINYIQHISPVYPGVEGRILFTDTQSVCHSSKNSDRKKYHHEGDDDDDAEDEYHVSYESTHEGLHHYLDSRPCIISALKLESESEEDFSRENMKESSNSGNSQIVAMGSLLIVATLCFIIL